MSSSSGSFPTESTTATTKRRSPSARAAAASIHNPSRGNIIDEASDSEAETVVLVETSSQDEQDSRGRDGRERASTEEVGWDSDDSDPKQSKRNYKKREVDAYSSELSSAPSAPSSPVRSSSRFRSARNGETFIKSQSHKQQQQQQHQQQKSQQQQHQQATIQGSVISRKRKAPIDRENDASSRSRSGPSKQSSRPSPFSPSPPPPNRGTQTSHPSLRTRSVQTGISPPKTTNKDKVKRKVPRPLNVRKERISDDQSPSSSRQGSPLGFPQNSRSGNRGPGSPVTAVSTHKPKRDPSGRTLLHRAAHRGILEEVVSTFNQYKELLNVEDHAGYIPLHEASLAGHTDVVRFLLECGSSVDVQSIQELDTPLMEAVEMGHLDIVKLLLEAGADPKKRNKKGANAIECISEENPQAPAIESALRAAEQKRRSKRSSDEENNRNSATIESHSSRDPSIASPVHDTAPTTSRQTHGRRKNARAEQTKNEMLWVEGGKTGLQKLREKARTGDTAMVHAIIERGVVPDVESLIGAIKGGHDDTVSMLLAFGADADPEPTASASTGKRNSEETPMLAAIGRGGLKILGYLIEQVNPLRKDSRGKTYMDIARERMGELWEEEVQVLQAAYDKAMKASKGKVPVELKASTDKSPKKLLEPPETTQSKRPRSRRDSNTSTRARKREDSTQPKMDENVISERESTVEPKARTRDPDSSAPGAVPKRRRLVSKKDLISEQDRTTQATASSRSSSAPKPSKSTTEKSAESRGSLPPKLKTESRDIDMLDIPEIKIDKRGRSDDKESSKRKVNAEGLTVKDPTKRSKSHEKESSKSANASKTTKSSTADPERKRNTEAKERDGVKRLKAANEAGNGRPKIKERRPKKVESDSDSDSDDKPEKIEKPEKVKKKVAKESVKEKDSVKESSKDQDVAKVRKLTKEGDRKKASTQEDSADRAERKRKEADKKQRIEAEQRKEQQRKEEEEEEARRIKALEEKEALRIIHLTTEQKAIITKASDDSTKYRLEEECERQRLEQERLEKIAEEKRLAELEEKRLLEEKLRLEEEERRRIAEEEEMKRKLEEEAIRKAAEEEERRQMEAKAEQERLRLEQEALLQKQLEEQRAEEKRKEEEEAKRKLMEEQCRLAEIRRRQALPFALREAANAGSCTFSPSEATKYMPLYVHAAEESADNLNGVDERPLKKSLWVLNVQAALVLGITDLSFAQYKFNMREVSESQRLRMWQLLRPMLSEPITFASMPEDVMRNQQENKEKFLNMDPLSWIKLDDFNLIIQSDAKYSHLLGKGVVKTSEINLTWNAICELTLRPMIT